MLATFSDEATIGHALAFEAALARAQAEEGLLTNAAACAVEAACAALAPDPTSLAEEAAHAGTLAIALVARIREALGEELAPLVHMGATSQDLADTVMMMQVKAGGALLACDLGRLDRALAALATSHATTPSMGRTLMQDALPIGWGLRLAQWAAGVSAAGTMLADAVRIHALVQCGGAVGTRSGSGGRGEAVAARLAAALGLAPGPPWHARRVGVAAIGAALGILIGSLGKMALDVALLAQNGIAEAHEPAAAGRGGSSTMAHKRNPTGCQTVLSAATRAPGLVASLLAGLPQQAERGLGGWQAEAPCIADLFLLASGATAAMADVAEGLEMNEERMALTLERSGSGVDVGESASIVSALLRTSD